MRLRANHSCVHAATTGSVHRSAASGARGHGPGQVLLEEPEQVLDVEAAQPGQGQLQQQVVIEAQRNTGVVGFRPWGSRSERTVPGMISRTDGPARDRQVAAAVPQGNGFGPRQMPRVSRRAQRRRLGRRGIRGRVLPVSRRYAALISTVDRRTLDGVPAEPQSRSPASLLQNGYTCRSR